LLMNAQRCLLDTCTSNSNRCEQHGVSIWIQNYISYIHIKYVLVTMPVA